MSSALGSTRLLGLMLSVLLIASYVVVSSSSPAYAAGSVTFDSNGGAGSMGTQTSESSATLTENAFTRAGYLFSGWNTVNNGLGTAYDDKASYDFSTSITLYAQWAWVPTWEPDYYPSGPQAGVDLTEVIGHGWELCWSGPYNGYAKFSDIFAACDGKYIFYTGWEGVSSTPESLPDKFDLLAAAPRSDVFTTTATATIGDATDSNGSNWYFGDDRGGSGDGSQAVGFTDNQSGSPCYHGSSSICWHSAPNITVYWSDDGTIPDWAADEPGLSPGWSLGSTRTLGQNSSMGNGANYTRAIFHAPDPVWTVTFHANSGSGSMSAQSGSSSSTLTSNSFTRTGFTFSGWNSEADGKGTDYADGATYDFSADIDLYAQWAAIPAPSESSEDTPSAGASAAASKPEDPAGGSLVVARGRVLELFLRQAPVAVPRDAEGAKFMKPVALVAGKEVAVKSEVKTEQAARYGVGTVVLDVGVKESDGKVDSVDGKPSLKIGQGASAELKISGLRPSSRMQVFLPAADGSFVELPSISVKIDGSIDDSVAFATPQGQKPLPVGNRFIQMFGFNRDGEQTVLEMPVSISQPLPAPATNRSTGEQPVLTPGQSGAFNAGTPETVSLSQADETLSLVGQGWSFEVTNTASNSEAENLTFTRDAPMVFAGKGFMPGTRADVWLFSDPSLLGTVDIAADGTFSSTFAVDSNFVPTGNHTLQIQGIGEDGFVRAANLGVVVNDLVDTPIGPVDSDPLSWLPFIFIGTSVGGVLVVVGVMLAVRRRQRFRDRLVPVSP